MPPIKQMTFFQLSYPGMYIQTEMSEWFEKETKNMSRRQIAQELECNFNMSGETVFHPEDLS
jgi:hypothetical protein